MNSKAELQAGEKLGDTPTGRGSPPAGQWRYFRNFVAYKKELITYEYG